jgi:aspartate dehydrogenase
MKRIALIGYGAIARIARQKLAEHDPDGTVRIAGVLVRPGHADATRAAFDGGTAVVTAIDALIGLAPDLVVECAGQGAVAEYGEAVLRAGLDLMVISTGALADDAVRARLADAARAAGRQVILPAGAIAGIDGLNALRIGGLERVRYISTKPPLAWQGTPAAERFDLATLVERTVLYTGPANEAARLYPKNANLAATWRSPGSAWRTPRYNWSPTRRWPPTTWAASRRRDGWENWWWNAATCPPPAIRRPRR